MKLRKFFVRFILLCLIISSFAGFSGCEKDRSNTGSGNTTDIFGENQDNIDNSVNDSNEDVMDEDDKSDDNTGENSNNSSDNENLPEELKELIKKSPSEGLDFILSEDERSYIVSGIGVCLDSDVVIPETYNNLPVTEIASNAFRGYTVLTGIVIPDSVLKINDSAFYTCTMLKNAYLGNSVEYIGSNAFTFTSLKNINIPNSLVEIEPCFHDTNLTFNSYNGLNYLGNEKNPYFLLVDVDNDSMNTYQLHEETVIIYPSAFKGCENLLSLTIPDKVTNISSNAFCECKRLKNITIPNSVHFVGDSAFELCSSLATVTVGNSVTVIGDKAFYYCTTLTDVTIPDSVISIGSSAFAGCSDLTTVVLSDGITEISYGTFEYCSSLFSINIPESVTVIDHRAFYKCGSLTSIIIPDSVVSVGEYTFRGCSVLTIYCEAQSKPDGWSGIWNYSDRPVVWGYSQ